MRYTGAYERPTTSSDQPSQLQRCSCQSASRHKRPPTRSAHSRRMGSGLDIGHLVGESLEVRGPVTEMRPPKVEAGARELRADPAKTTVDGLIAGEPGPDDPLGRQAAAVHAEALARSRLFRKTDASLDGPREEGRWRFHGLADGI